MEGEYMGGYLSVSVCGEWGWGVNVREEGGGGEEKQLTCREETRQKEKKKKRNK